MPTDTGPIRGGIWLRDDKPTVDDHGGKWAVDVWIALRGHRPVIGEIRVYPAAPDTPLGKPWEGEPANVPRRGLEKRFLVKVPLGRYVPMMLGQLQRDLKRPSEVERKIERFFWNYMLPGSLALAERPRPRRNTGRDDRFYLELAAEYVERIATGSRSPVKDIAVRRGVKKHAHVRDWLHEARERGLLAAAEPGKPNATLLPRALALLRERQKRGPKKRGGRR
jgi:hypothetical protein